MSWWDASERQVLAFPYIPETPWIYGRTWDLLNHPYAMLESGMSRARYHFLHFRCRAPGVTTVIVCPLPSLRCLLWLTVVHLFDPAQSINYEAGTKVCAVRPHGDRSMSAQPCCHSLLLFRAVSCRVMFRFSRTLGSERPSKFESLLRLSTASLSIAKGSHTFVDLGARGFTRPSPH